MRSSAASRLRLRSMSSRTAKSSYDATFGSAQTLIFEGGSLAGGGSAAMGTEGRTMTEALQPDTLGPVDVAVILFEGAPSTAMSRQRSLTCTIRVSYVSSTSRS